jgi:hypothetical protein
MTMSRIHTSSAVAAMIVVLAACGGGDAGSEPQAEADPLAAVPDQATQNAPAMVSYLASLSKALSEVREAIDLSALGSMFTSDSTEPEPLP